MAAPLLPHARPGFTPLPLEAIDAALQWLEDRRAAAPVRQGVGVLVGTGWDAYVKITHPLLEDLSPSDVLAAHYRDYRPGWYAVDWDYLREIRRLISGASQASFPFRWLRASALAARLGAPFTPRFLAELPADGFAINGVPQAVPPGITNPGRMPRVLAEQLVAALQPFAGTDPCWFYWPLYGPGEPSIGGSVVARAPLAAVPTVLRVEEDMGQFENRVPDYWWPADRSWVLCADFDLDFTVVAGSRAVAAALLTDATLDALAVAPDEPL